MNLYQTLKGLEQFVKEWPKYTKLLKSLGETQEDLKKAMVPISRLNQLDRLSELSHLSHLNQLSRLSELEQLSQLAKASQPAPSASLNAVEYQAQWPNPKMELPLARATTRSSLCKQADFLSEYHQAWCRVLRESPIFHRK